MNTGNLANSGIGGNEILLPPSHNVFDQNNMIELVASHAQDVEISNYISKMSGEDGSNEFNFPS